MARDGKVRNEATDTLPLPLGSIAANGARATAAPLRLTPGATRRRPSPDGARPSLAAIKLKRWSARAAPPAVQYFARRPSKLGAGTRLRTLRMLVPMAHSKTCF